MTKTSKKTSETSFHYSDLATVHREWEFLKHIESGDFRQIAEWLRNIKKEETISPYIATHLAEILDPREAKKKGKKRTVFQKEKERHIVKNIAYISARNNISETKAIEEIAESLNVSNRTIWSYLKENREYFEDIKNSCIYEAIKDTAL